ncbi:WXG100 family type VII secretion target [Herpetosiphon llansteffanensis]
MKIGIDVDLADALKSAINTQSSEVEQQLGTLKNTVSTLLETWIGRNRAPFEEEWGRWQNDVGSLINSMREMESRLNITANAFRDADKF